MPSAKTAIVAATRLAKALFESTEKSSRMRVITT